MRHLFILGALLAASACTETSTESFDGQYRVAVRQTTNTCNTQTVGANEPGLTTRLDLFRRSDGLYDLHWIDGWVPEDFAYSAIDLGDGEISHDVGGSAEIAGAVSVDSLHLQLVRRGQNSQGQACERRLEVRGSRRPMFSADSIDGRFIASFEHLGGVCADGTQIPAAGAWNMRMEVLPFRDDRTSVLIEDQKGGLLRFWIEPLGKGGAVHLTHDLFFAADGDNITPLDGTVEGTIEPDRIDLTADIVVKDDPRACKISYVITAKRWTPSASSFDAEYRATYRTSDTCGVIQTATYEDAAFAVGQTDHQLDLIDTMTQSTVVLDGTNVTSRGSLIYRGTVTPDSTSYLVEDHYTANGRACVYTLEVAGTARYR